MQYVIRTDEPFRGYVQSVVNLDGTIGYDRHPTLESYADSINAPLRIISESELEQMVKEFRLSMISDKLTEISEQDFMDALNCLPPCRWGSYLGVELFHVSERITYDLVNWYAQLNGRYWTFTDKAGANADELARKVASASQQERNK